MADILSGIIQLFGHVRRMGRERLPNVVIDWMATRKIKEEELGGVKLT